VVQEHITTSRDKQVGRDKSANPDEDSDSDMALFNNDKKRRGRKRERDDLYFEKAINKIDEIR